jgi:hypothetical protein
MPKIDKKNEVMEYYKQLIWSKYSVNSNIIIYLANSTHLTQIEY